MDTHNHTAPTEVHAESLTYATHTEKLEDLQNSLLGAVETQRSKLINAVSVVQCMRVACRGGEPPQELEGALELLEEEMQRILDGLEAPAILREAWAEEESRE